MKKTLTSIIFLVCFSVSAQIDSTNYLTYLETQIRAIGWPLPIPENPNNYTNDIYTARAATNYPPNDLTNTNILNQLYATHSAAPSLTTTRISYECYNWLLRGHPRSNALGVAWDRYLGRGTTNLNSSNTVVMPLILLSNKLTALTPYILITETPFNPATLPIPEMKIITNYFQAQTPPKRVLEIMKYLRAKK